MRATNLRAGVAAMRGPDLRAGVAGTAEPTQARAADNGVIFITDDTGRKLQLRDALTLLEEQRLLVAMGAHSDNARALQRALIAARVAAIDEQGIPVPQSFRLYEAMLHHVGLVGLVAVVAHLAPPPVGEPLAIFDGEPGEYRLFAHEGGVGLWRVEDEAPAEDSEIATAKK